MFTVAIKVWGDFACFTRSESKINRVSYDVPTPSACRGVLEAIYCKPLEFWYEITKIKVLNPIRQIGVLKNEITKKTDPNPKTMKPIVINNDTRTQRYTYYLRDVAYIIEANVHVRESYRPDIPMYEKERKINTEFEKRVRKGKCFSQPYFGLKECMCFFEEPDGDEKPIDETRHLGVMLYDIFDPSSQEPLNTSRKKKENNVARVVKPSYFVSEMINGVVDVPLYNSDEVVKPV